MAHWSDPDAPANDQAAVRMNAYDQCDPAVRALLREISTAPRRIVSLAQAQSQRMWHERNEAAEMRAKLEKSNV